MADFTSIQSGNWADGATWGNTSPGSAGVDYPGVDGDTATVAATHTVSYDLGDSTVNFGSITLNGKLSFPATANSTINFADLAVLTINSGGELEVGTETIPIDAAYHAHIYWAQGAAARYVMVLNDGGKITVWGDPSYYNNTKKLTLAAAWDASAGDTLYVTGDQTATWPVGAKFYLNKGYVSGTYAGSTDYQTDADIFEIASIGTYDTVNDNTSITVVAGHGSTLNFLAGQKLLVIGRNIILGDPGAPWEVYGHSTYTETIRFDNNQGASNNLISINDCVFFGWERVVDGGSNFYGGNLVFVSCNTGSNYGTNNQFTGDFVSCNTGFNYGTNNQFTGDFVSCNMGSHYGTNNQFTGDFVSCNTGSYGGTNNQFTGDFVSCNTGSLYGTNNQFTGDFVSCNTGSRYGTNSQFTGDFVSCNTGSYCGTNHSFTGNFISNTIDISLANENTIYSNILEDCEVGGVILPLRVYKNSGNYLPLQSTDTDWVAPPSGNSWILQCLPNSYCRDSYAGELPLSPLGEMAAWATTANTSIGFQIYPVGWTTALTEAEIHITARYYDAATGNSRTSVTTASATFANGAWSLCSAAIAPAQDGIVYYQLMVKTYEPGAYILVDPEVVIS